MNDLLTRHEEQFRAYTRPFLAGGDGNVSLKQAHTFRVLDNARALCDFHSLNGDTRKAVLLGALYHDIGRFPQYRDYGTFRDSDSANHALLGIGALHRNRFLKDLPDTLRRTVHAAVSLHNVRILPQNTPAEIRRVVCAVRDADKLDIFPVVLDHLENPDMDGGVILMNTRRDPERYTPELLEQILSGALGDYSLMEWSNDFAILLSGWVFDLNYGFSSHHLSKRGLIDRLLHLLPDTPQIRELKQRVLGEIERRSANNAVAIASCTG
ncbi:HD domain-containing protein [Salidesulfovibrio brasiliensis]|uniref:HD domain-containing protein n=1 Tax=Salidesulfovibrio brasiliensis TaxID=221711 RepID=UPI0006D2B7E1|nr:HD domain-containing protein [Salidesulfovibrio brasiliensis]